MKILIPFLALLLPAAADSLHNASITAAMNEVLVYPGSSASHPASIGEKIALPTSVQTGRRSRAELTFTDNTITRLGQNSIFSFSEGSRDVELKQGTVMLQVPKNAGGATIRTATVTAAITGTTVLVEYSPGKWVKIIVLEGKLKVSIKGKKNTVTIPAGQMLVMHPNGQVIPQLLTIDVAKLIATCNLLTHGGFAQLPPTAITLIEKTIQEQLNAKKNGELMPTCYIISGGGSWTMTSLLNSSQHNRFDLSCGCGSGPRH